MQGKCVPGCEENVIGMIFYRYMVTTGLLLSLSDIASAAFWKYLVGQPYDFDAPQVSPATPMQLALKSSHGYCIVNLLIMHDTSQEASLPAMYIAHLGFALNDKKDALSM